MKQWFTTPRALKRMGVLAMNRRNIEFIFGYNERSRYPMVDDKLETKRLAEAANLKTPPLIGVVKYHYEVAKLTDKLSGYDEFVIKPSKGSAGKGILVITGREGNTFLKGNGERLSLKSLQRHTANILSGLHSLGGQPDCAMIEGRIHFAENFAALAAHGVPDLRVLVFRGYPAMAMLRIPTKASDGKANLHQGAVGVGVDLANGHASGGVQFNKLIKKHPDFDSPFNEIWMENWEELLVLASRAYDITKLGYLGVDLVIDARHGPQVLELNARPGLAIQLANGCGLLPRLEKLKALGAVTEDAAARVSRAREMFRGV